MTKLMKMLFYNGKIRLRYCKIISYLDDAKLFFSTSRYELLGCLSVDMTQLKPILEKYYIQ